MEMTSLAFYGAAAVAILATLRVISAANPVHALLYLVLSLISVAMIFFTVGAPFAGALEVIVYAGAIMVLFIFVVMLLSLGTRVSQQEKDWLRLRYWIWPSLLSLFLLVLLWGMLQGNHPLSTFALSTQDVGVVLFGPYMLAVELASMLLLAAMIAAWHIGRPEEKKE